MNTSAKTFGKKWTDDEEEQLLKEMSENLDLNLIATAHDRSLGGITSRIKEVAYKLYKKDVTVADISLKTKLSVDEINDIISKKSTPVVKKSKDKVDSSASSTQDDSLKKELASLNKKLDSVLQLLTKK